MGKTPEQKAAEKAEKERIKRNREIVRQKQARAALEARKKAVKTEDKNFPPTHNG